MNSLPGYETTQQAAVRLSLTDSRIRQLLAEGRFDGAIKLGGLWLLPVGATPEPRQRGRPPRPWRTGGEHEKGRRGAR